MSEAIEVRHQVAIAGRVIDTVTRKPLGGAVVNIVEMPPAFKAWVRTRSVQYGSRWKALMKRPDMTLAAPDGLFYFLDLPDGKYTVSAVLRQFGRRYGSAHAATTVSRDRKPDMKPAFLEMGLPPTAVQGKITGSGHKSGVVLAEVRVKGSGERVFSDAQGEYLLAGVEPGKRMILVTAQGYRAAAKPVSIDHPGDLATLNFVLTREAAG